MEKITFHFKNRTAIVTGGAQGFGLDISKRFLKCGAKVIMWDNDPKALEKAVKNIADDKKIEMPIMNAIYNILYNQYNIKDVINNLLERPIKDEIK